MLVQTGCIVMMLNVPGYELTGSGVLARGGIIAGADTAKCHCPGPACIITASPPSVVTPA